MKSFRLIAAAAALASVGSAHALAPSEFAGAQKVYIAGASALRLSLAAHMQSICKADTFDVYFSTNSGSPGDNHRAYSCEIAVAGQGYPVGTKIFVMKRDQGGSGQGVQPIANKAFQEHMRINATSCTATSNPSPATDIQKPTYHCSTVIGTAASVGAERVISDAGISDVEPNLLNQSINRPIGTPAVDVTKLTVKPFVQALFGVIVNKNAYEALQQAQFGAVVSTPYESGTTITAASQAAFDAKIPSIPSTWVRSALTAGGGVTGDAALARGWDLLLGTSANGKQINICRRTTGSGTQAATNAFFGNNPCGAGFGAAQAMATQTGTLAANGRVAVNEGTSSALVETCMLNVNNIAGAYGVGVIGRENNPFANGGDKQWRYVALDGNVPSRANGLTGAYPFVYESTIQWNIEHVTDANKLAFLDAISKAAAPAALAVVDADTQQGVMSPPASWNGLTLSAVEKTFASRVQRNPGNSCSVLRLAQ